MRQHDLRTFKTIKVLYEDDCYIAFDKPPRLLVIPSPKKEKNTLINIVNPQGGANKNAGKWHPCHRLDRDTSGVIVFGKSKKYQKLLMDEFKRRTVKKKYIALIHGRLKNKGREIRSSIIDFDKRKFASLKKTRKNFALKSSEKVHGKLAITRYQVLTQKKHYSIVEVFPITGRTNQIRIHFSEIGRPLVGERKYAFAKDYMLKFRRTALHASELEWPHPVYHKFIRIKAPMPKDMVEFIARN